MLTHTPGQVEFLPATKADKKRTMNGERIYIDYGSNNAIRSFRSVQVTTRTESVGKNAKTVVSVTKSRDLKADFDPQTGQMTRLEQWNDFPVRGRDPARDGGPGDSGVGSRIDYVADQGAHVGRNRLHGRR